MLTDVAIRQATAKTKAYKLFDTAGLYLRVSPLKKDKKAKPTKTFVFRYQWLEKEKTINIGRYGRYSLTQARVRRDEFIDQLLSGNNPAEDKCSQSFSEVGDEWFDLSKVSKRWTDKTIQTNKTRLDYAKHGFGDKEIAKVTAEDVLRVCRKLEKKGSIDTAKRTRGVISQILRYSMLYDVTEQVKGALLTRESVNHPHLTDKKDIAELMTRLKNYHGSFETKQALLFVVYTFVRQKCWRLAEWKEIDGDMWRVPSNHMKNDKDFLVPLSRQALEIISTMKELNGDNRYIFSYAHKPDQALSVSTLSRVLSRMGYKDKQTPHGFRHVASTWLNELQYDAGAIELQLAHITKGVAGVYNKAEKIDYRKKMMQDWADWLDSL